ncbi:MAG: hypothetical protein ACO3TS_03235 [Candidatus Nanopelagicales bacterium]
MPDQLLDLAVLMPASRDSAGREHLARLAGRLGYLAVHVQGELDREELESLIAAADPAMVVVDETDDIPGIVRSNDPAEVRRARSFLDAQEDQRPLIVALPISIGRTRNEAVARAAREPSFVGDSSPEVCGIFGTFEEAQEQVLELARAGAEVLLLTVPDELDIADVLAQIRALVVGATPALFQR